jgi:hypothetical protein
MASMVATSSLARWTCSPVLVCSLERELPYSPPEAEEAATVTFTFRKQEKMFRDVLRSNAIIYNIVHGEVVELELYAAKADDDGRQTPGEWLACFTRVETGFW